MFSWVRFSSSSGIVSFLYDPTIKVEPILEPPTPALVFIKCIEEGDIYNFLNGLVGLPKSYIGEAEDEGITCPPASIVGWGPTLNVYILDTWFGDFIFKACNPGVAKNPLEADIVEFPNEIVSVVVFRLSPFNWNIDFSD